MFDSSSPVSSRPSRSLILQEARRACPRRPANYLLLKRQKEWAEFPKAKLGVIIPACEVACVQHVDVFPNSLRPFGLRPFMPVRPSARRDKDEGDVLP